jgi:hypothetical protein
MTAPSIDNSDRSEREAYVLEQWKCLGNCEICGKCHILKGRDAETVYADYIEGRKSYIEVTIELRDKNY